MDRYTFDPSGDLHLVFVDPANPESKVEDEANSTKISNGIRMLASSKHLMVASSMFRIMLQNGHFREGAALASLKHVEIPLPEDDADAFEIVLNIIHGRARRAPKTVDLGLLTKLAVLVDKYQLHEPVELCSEHWINNIKASIEYNFGPNLPSWLCIAWVFSLDKEFVALTQIAELYSSKSLRGCSTDHLPIPAQVIDDIESKRVKAIQKLVDTIQELLANYRGTTKQCTGHSTIRTATTAPLPQVHPLGTTAESNVRGFSFGAPAQPTSNVFSGSSSGGFGAPAQSVTSVFDAYLNAQPSGGGRFGGPSSGTGTLTTPQPYAGAFGTNARPSGGSLFGRPPPPPVATSSDPNLGNTDKTPSVDRRFGTDHRIECDAMMLGRLEKLAMIAGIEPPPTDYDGIAFNTLHANLSDIQIRSLCDRVLNTQSTHPDGTIVVGTAHGVKSMMVSRFAVAKESLTGLKVANYKASK